MRLLLLYVLCFMFLMSNQVTIAAAAAAESELLTTCKSNLFALFNRDSSCMAFISAAVAVILAKLFILFLF